MPPEGDLGLNDEKHINNFVQPVQSNVEEVEFVLIIRMSKTLTPKPGVFVYKLCCCAAATVS